MHFSILVGWEGYVIHDIQHYLLFDGPEPSRSGSLHRALSAIASRASGSEFQQCIVQLKQLLVLFFIKSILGLGQ